MSRLLTVGHPLLTVPVTILMLWKRSRVPLLPPDLEVSGIPEFLSM